MSKLDELKAYILDCQDNYERRMELDKFGGESPFNTLYWYASGEAGSRQSILKKIEELSE